MNSSLIGAAIVLLYINIVMENIQNKEELSEKQNKQFKESFNEIETYLVGKVSAEFEDNIWTLLRHTWPRKVQDRYRYDRLRKAAYRIRYLDKNGVSRKLSKERIAMLYEREEQQWLASEAKWECKKLIIEIQTDILAKMSPQEIETKYSFRVREMIIAH